METMERKKPRPRRSFSSRVGFPPCPASGRFGPSCLHHMSGEEATTRERPQKRCATATQALRRRHGATRGPGRGGRGRRGFADGPRGWPRRMGAPVRILFESRPLFRALAGARNRAVVEGLSPEHRRGFLTDISHLIESKYNGEASRNRVYEVVVARRV
jgi:hypothetical protein